MSGSGDYISRDAANEACWKSVRRYPNSFYNGLETARDAIRKLPAADVRSVVLCRDCKWCHAGYCENYDDLIPFGCANKPWEDWFCADGEKREKS